MSEEKLELINTGVSDMSEEKNGESEISALLRGAGFEVVEGKDAVLQMMRDKAGPPHAPLCSGYGVFPDGEKCKGCSDCA